MTNQYSDNRRDRARRLRVGSQLAVSLGATLVSLVVLTSCGGEARLVPPTIVSSPPLTTPVRVGTPVLATPIPAATTDAIVWATAVDPLSQAPLQSVVSYAADSSTIYACLSAKNLPAGT